MGNSLSLWISILSYLAMVAGIGLSATGLALLLFGVVLRSAL